MRTIRDALIQSTNLLKTNSVSRHIEACIIVYTELSAIKNFPIEPMNVFAFYQRYLMEKYKSFEKVGFWEKVSGLIKAFILKRKLKKQMIECHNNEYGDGDELLKDMFNLIWKVL